MTITDLSTYHPVFLLKRLSTIPFIPGKKNNPENPSRHRDRWRLRSTTCKLQWTMTSAPQRFKSTTLTILYIQKNHTTLGSNCCPTKTLIFFPSIHRLFKKKTPFPPNFSGENTSCGLASDSQKRMSWRIWILGWNGGPWRIKITTAWMSCWYFGSMDYTNLYFFAGCIFSSRKKGEIKQLTI